MENECNQFINITGVVQGVGFRPFVYTLAVKHGLHGWVRNTSHGVDIELNASAEEARSFVDEIRRNKPPLAKIDQISLAEVAYQPYESFTIVHSQPQPGEFLPVSPDVKICADCAREMADPADRRYRYPFINCTNCGPRFTIIRDIPYDRPLTTMAGFQLCPDCEKEYQNPLDRRFHAQPIACPVCGPHLTLIRGPEQIEGDEPALTAAREMLAAGRILAIKGLGGYHLACDAFNADAVNKLRRRKQRSDKAFALMAYDMAVVRRFFQPSDSEASLLVSPAAPIVLIDGNEASASLRSTAPGQTRFGVMLAYTPQHLLLTEPAPGFPELLVMTSGNLSEEPIAYQDEDALQRLAPLVDGFLIHDRPIHMRVDDSVYRAVDGQPYPLRRSRGFAPDPIRLSYPLPELLACGAEQKNTFSLSRGNYAFMSPHIGDMENLETYASYQSGIEHFQRLFKIKPQAIICDMHPDYLPTRYAEERAAEENLPLIKVQHHHAHLAGCLADNGYPLDQPAIGLIFDGTGLGTDGKIWGGEVLVGNAFSFTRRYHLQYMRLPGGEAAIRQPARIALAYLGQLGLAWQDDLAPVFATSVEERAVISRLLEMNLNAPETSSMGRLFDAVSSLIGVRQAINYEAQAAIELETLADPAYEGSYKFDLEEDTVLLKGIFEAILRDLRLGTPGSVIAAAFHNTIARLAAELAVRSAHETACRLIALSGGVWQNHYLLQKTLKELGKHDLQVIIHRQVPANDGGLALGQLVIGAAQLKEGK